MSERKLLAEKEVDAIEREAYVAFAPLPTMLAAVLNLIYTVRALYRTIAAVRVDSSAPIVTEWDDVPEVTDG